MTREQAFSHLGIGGVFSNGDRCPEPSSPNLRRSQTWLWPISVTNLFQAQSFRTTLFRWKTQAPLASLSQTISLDAPWLTSPRNPKVT